MNMLARLLQFLFGNKGAPYPLSDETPTAEEMYDTRPDPFLPAVELVLRHEGGLVDHPRDPGGLTNFGISQRAYPNLDIRSLTRDDAIAIYRRDYWDANRCGEMPGGIGLSVFDFAVNAGNHRAVTLLQRIVGVTVDGVAGPKTLAATRGAGAAECRRYADGRLSFYRSLSTWDAFGRGWTRRTEETLQEALKLCD